MAAPLAAKTVRAGIEAWQSGDHAAAVAIWRPLAEKGDSDAAFNLGQAYRLGRGVGVDLALAQRWLSKAAQAGHLDAQTTLGLLLFDSGSRDSALQWLKRAAERGEPRAMLVYGTALFNGDGVPRDPVLAYAYVSRSAAQGLEPAKSTLVELDATLPVDVRQKGVAIALSKAKPKSPPSASARPDKKPAVTPVAKVAEKPAASAATTATTGRWRIQLGAFSKRASAETLYRRLSTGAPVAGHQAFYVPAGAVTRLQVGPYPSRAAATTACAALSSKGQACFPVEAK
ncbi:MAG: SEL1-like repeat protein [Sphingomonas sp.]|nr:SEL1-like repeat protein [Sphingomonas sp.]